ncbi:MAG: ATP-binding protein [Bacteroidia bacterium]
MNLTFRNILFLLILHCGFLLWQKAEAQNYVDSTYAIIQKIDTANSSAQLVSLIDSLEKVLAQNPSDSFLVDQLDYVVYFAGFGDQPTRTLNDLLQRICDHYLGKNIQEKTRNYYKDYLAKSLSTEAEFLAQENRNSEVIATRYKALALSQEVKDSSLMSQIIQNLGIDYFNSANYDEAEKMFNKVIELEKLRKNPGGILRGKVKRAEVLAMRGNTQEAIPIFEEYLAYVIEREDEAGIVNTEYSLGLALKRQGDYDRAIPYLEDAMEKMKPFGYYFGIGQILKELSLIAEQREDWETMYRNGLEIQKLAEETGYPQLKKNAAEILYKVYRQRGDYKKSLEVYMTFMDLRDSITGKARTREMLQQQHIFEMKQDSIQDAARLALEIESKKRSQSTATALWVILGLILLFAFILWNRFRVTQQQKRQLDQANDELKKLDKTKSRFFANISHELRTPLTVISGMANLLDESETRSLIKSNSHKLLNLVNQILDLSKLEANKLRFHMKQEDIIPWLRYLVESFHSYAESKSIDLEFSTELESQIMDFDPERINSIVTNLLSNAIKFTREEGRVRTMVSRKDDLLEIAVSDNGIGIPEDKLDQVFVRFFQIDDSNTRHGEGTGIGLALTKDLVEAFGGTISVESTEGEGSTFIVRLPIRNTAAIEEESGEMLQLKQNKKELSHPEEEGPVGTAPYNLLIVEDNDDLVTYLKTVLGEHYKLLVARNGEEGINMAIREVPDLILSDVMMPEKDGFELCQTLKEDDRTSHIPIVLLTARSDAESRISGLARGADAYLPKPFDQEELMVRLENLIKLRQRLQTRYQSKASPNEDVLTQKEDAFILKLRSLIVESIDDPDLNVAALCELMRMSRTQLHNKVKALTGLSSSRFLRKVRMEEARKLLLNSDLQIAEIAFRVGYQAPAYFTRMFVEEFGITPSELRKS